MKKYLSYIFIILLVVALITVFFSGSKKTNRRIDSRITFRKKDKRPYGMYVAYENLKHLFPLASVSTNTFEPGYWDSLSTYSKNQALIIVVDRFSANDNEINNLIAFAEQGNDVFISARELSFDAKKIFKCKVANETEAYSFDNERGINDSLTLALSNPPFETAYTYTYPGRSLSSYFLQVDTSITDIVGTDEDGNPDFIHLQVDKGNLYIQLAPIAFSNYFLLHKENIGYYEKCISLINPFVKKIVWDEYYLNNNLNSKDSDKTKDWLSVLSNYPALKAALLTAFLTLLVYVLLEMRRKQRYIPVMITPKNDSLDFVKTIGRLYFDKGNHKNLCQKMSLYFLEYVRNKYNLPTNNMNEDFINNLKFKSGVDEISIREIISFIKYLDDAPDIAPKQATLFHSQLESFYKKA